MLSSRASAGSPLAIARACSRRCLAASAAATAGSLAIAGGDSPGVVAAQLGMARSELIEAAEVYREAGRAALSELLARREPEKGRSE